MIFLKGLFLIVITSSLMSSGETALPTSPKSNQTSQKPYSFRPLLIQGKKRVSRTARDLKIEGEEIVGSDLFFIDIDFKQRIFE